MNKEIRHLVIEIIVFAVVAIGSIPIWSGLSEDNLKTTQGLLAYSSNLTIDKVTDNNYTLFPMTDEYAINNLEVNTLKINNVSNKKLNYKLVFNVDNTSTLDISSFKIKVNDKIIKISDNYLSCDEEYCYYLLDTLEITSKKDTNVDYILWLDENTTTVNGNIIYSFSANEI